MTQEETEGRGEIRLPDDREVRAALEQCSRAGIADVVVAHPGSALAWAELADLAFSEGRVLDAYAYAAVAVDRSLQALSDAGWSDGDAVPWEHEPNRAYLRALHAQRRAAATLGLGTDALDGALAGADAGASARIDSEFTPTQVISVIDLSMLDAAGASETFAESDGGE